MLNAMQNDRDDKNRSTGNSSDGRTNTQEGQGHQTQSGQGAKPGSNDGRSNNGRNLSQEDRSRGGQAAASHNERDDQGRFSNENR